MKRTALLMCRNQSSLRLLAELLDQLQIEPELCFSADEAMELVLEDHYSALILDFDLPQAWQVARMTRMSSVHRRPVIFAMVGARTHVGESYQAGANFMLYKPLAAEQVMHALRAGRAFMRADRRQATREKLEALVYLQFGIAQLPGLILDLSQQGLSLQAPEPLPAVHRVPLRFVLPGTSNMIEGIGEVIWADDEGRAGMAFSQLTADSRSHLRNWLQKREMHKASRQGAARSERTRVSSMTAH
ncbi:MAG TPA: PilZ domain-containing protein [Terriglobales bacterium]|nr:PilZ domain-containing protein [Terriglobales bacterium]